MEAAAFGDGTPKAVHLRKSPREVKTLPDTETPNAEQGDTPPLPRHKLSIPPPTQEPTPIEPSH